MSSEQDPILRKLVNWGSNRPSVRAVILTSTRTIPDASLDPFSDYDVIVVVTAVRPYYEDRSWLDVFGKVLVLYRDPMKADSGHDRFAYITQYEDGLKIDFTLWPVDILEKFASDPNLPDELDAGYLVLLDKDGLAADLKPPSYQAYIPSPPDRQTYETTVEEFFHETTYVAKLLWRDELMPAKYSLDYVMKSLHLHRMLVWYVEIDGGWKVKPGVLGKGLKKQLAPGTWHRLESTYVGADLEDNWTALFESVHLFRDVAEEVAKKLGYEYPHELEKRVVKYLQQAKNIDRS
jgi:aminoglycoside 6-adenylyltransferase